MKETIRDLYIIYIYARLRMIHVCYKNSSFDSNSFYLLSLVSIKLDSVKKIFQRPVLRHSLPHSSIRVEKISRTILGF